VINFACSTETRIIFEVSSLQIPAKKIPLNNRKWG